MPTVANQDVLGPMTWGSGGNARHFVARLNDRSDARGGINSLLFGAFGDGSTANGGTPCAPQAPAPSVPQEHAYAAGLGAGAGAPGSFVSQNGYYGYHQQLPGPSAMAPHDGEGQDYSMDTSENNLPDHAFGAFGAASGFGAPLGPAPAAQRVWNADADPIDRNQLPLQARKRNFEARGPVEADDMYDQDVLLHRAVKRTKSCPYDEGETGAATQAMSQVQSFGVPSSAQSIDDQNHTPVQMYDLPIQQLPRSTSQLADAMTPRPRCLMGHFI